MRHFRASDGAELTFDESGSGHPALVFVHGWQADRDVWRGIVDALAPNVRCVEFDLRGSGSAAAVCGPYNVERFAADIRDLATALGGDPIVVVGHSMGATVALRFAVEYRELSAALVLVAPVPASGGGYSPAGVEYLRATAGNAEAARAWLARTLYDSSNGAVLDRLCAAAAKTERAVALESFESWAFADFAEETRAIEAPVLVIAPEKDAPDIKERKVSALLPNSEYVMLPNSAHYAIVEQPQAIADLIRKFVAT
jgi:pimeloyl-ACP methyl ester carboxylesterase